MWDAACRGEPQRRRSRVLRRRREARPRPGCRTRGSWFYRLAAVTAPAVAPLPRGGPRRLPGVRRHGAAPPRWPDAVRAGDRHTAAASPPTGAPPGGVPRRRPWSRSPWPAERACSALARLDVEHAGTGGARRGGRTRDARRAGRRDTRARRRWPGRRSDGRATARTGRPQQAARPVPCSVRSSASRASSRTGSRPAGRPTVTALARSTLPWPAVPDGRSPRHRAHVEAVPARPRSAPTARLGQGPKLLVSWRVQQHHGMQRRRGKATDAAGALEQPNQLGHHLRRLVKGGDEPAGGIGQLDGVGSLEHLVRSLHGLDSTNPERSVPWRGSPARGAPARW